MSSRAMSLKGRINNYAKENHIAAQVVLQNFMFERFLARLSDSSFRDKFVVKGGMLVAAIVGLGTRATMDLDTTLRDFPLTEVEIRKAFREIISIDKGDEVVFLLQSVEPIRKDDIYGGFRVRIDAKYDTIVTPLSIDVSTGDAMTPHPVSYIFRGIFDDNIQIPLWGYNVETILAEKLETILCRGVFTTRPRDFYDVYILGTTQPVDKKILRDAINATSTHRGSTVQISDIASILKQVKTNLALINQWEKYRRQFPYAADITYNQVLEVIERLLEQQ
ncbi:MAG: nucleotidyl transferase AbiEii/AbiGii toxin family protein [Firmicutes bacterium]|nr:nucleotidyl transferase AbiEii/AbiGii toxin family protein [Bacillota bacterium]